ncbi:MAG: hypothetical protein ACI4DY_09045 [Monoglobaceae bacterium]
MELIDEVKLNLRRTSNALDEEIRADINAAYADMKRVGINTADSKNPLIVKAIKLYCRWQTNFAGLGDRYQANYESLRDSMALSAAYKDTESENV